MGNGPDACYRLRPYVPLMNSYFFEKHFEDRRAQLRGEADTSRLIKRSKPSTPPIGPAESEAEPPLLRRLATTLFALGTTRLR